MPHPSQSARRDAADVTTFIDKLSSGMHESGLPRMPARVFAALLASDEGRLTSAELTEELGVSAAAVSGGVRWLIQVGFVERHRERGSRRDVFVLHSDVWYELMVQDMASLRQWEDGLRYGVQALGEETAAGRRVAESLEFFEFIRTEMPAVMEKWRTRRRTQSTEHP